MMNRRILKCFFLSLCLFLFSSLELSASSASLSFSGNGTVYVDNRVEVTLSVSNVNAEGGITAIGGKIDYDANYLRYESYNSLSPIKVSFEPSTKMFGGLSFGGPAITGNTGVIKLTFIALKTGTTTISFSGPSISDSTSSDVSVNYPSKSITITNPPSSNTNLSSLSVSGTNISLGNLSANVGKDVTSVSVSATAEDSGASVSGTGTKQLNYGQNKITVTVKAPSGATKDYTFTINREDPRSNNNNLSSLTVSGGDLSPKFKASTTTYTMTVPFSVENLNIKATAEDKKATVSISNQNGLPAEATTDVLIKVTAENGSVKTYTIKVTREKDPNKPKSGNNYLSSLTANIGILSPVFDKEKLNYVIYLPFEVDRIEFSATVEDTQYGVLETEGPDTLTVGNNKYTFKVTTEDGTSRTYIVNVVRGASVDGNTSNLLLKDLKIDSGNLDKSFDSSVNVYRYNKKKGFKINPIPEDENTKVTVIEHDDVYTILLENSNGDSNVYTLIPKESAVSSNNIALIIAMAIASVPLIGGGVFIGYKTGMKKMLNKVKNLTQKTTESIKQEPSIEEKVKPEIEKSNKEEKNKKSKKSKKNQEDVKSKK